MDFEALQRRMADFATERDWDQFQTPKNLVMALAGEVGELVSVFQWLTPEESDAVMAGPRAEQVRDEVADVLIYLVSLAARLDLDVDAAVSDKLAKTAGRYTVHRSRGSAEKVPHLAPVLGVDACKGGWVGALWADGRVELLTSATIGELVEAARAIREVAVVAVDIPIGLPDSGRRQADVLVRRALPGKASSVFNTLTRAAYEAKTYAEAREANVAATGGLGAGAQSYALAAKILQVDDYVRSGPPVEVIEVHPELCFTRLAGAPILDGKKTTEGRRARLAALRSAGIEVDVTPRLPGVATDDLLDACAAAWSASRHSLGESESHPEAPEVFSDGIRAAIRV